MENNFVVQVFYGASIQYQFVWAFHIKYNNDMRIFGNDFCPIFVHEIGKIKAENHSQTKNISSPNIAYRIQRQYVLQLLYHFIFICYGSNKYFSNYICARPRQYKCIILPGFDKERKEKKKKNNNLNTNTRNKHKQKNHHSSHTIYHQMKMNLYLLYHLSKSLNKQKKTK